MGLDGLGALGRQLAVEERLELFEDLVAVSHGCSAMCVGLVVGCRPLFRVARRRSVARGRARCVHCPGDAPASLDGELIQLLLHRLSSPVEAGHHRADRDVEDLGDLLVGEPLDVGQQTARRNCSGRSSRAGFTSSSVNRSISSSSALRLASLLEGADPPVEVEVLDVVEVGLLRAALLGPVRVDVRVREDPVQPGPEVGALGERAEAPVGPQVRLLDEVLGVGGGCASCAGPRSTAGGAYCIACSAKSSRSAIGATLTGGSRTAVDVPAAAAPS